jgi:hypothetical protein
VESLRSRFQEGLPIRVIAARWQIDAAKLHSRLLRIGQNRYDREMDAPRPEVGPVEQRLTVGDSRRRDSDRKPHRVHYDSADSDGRSCLVGGSQTFTVTSSAFTISAAAGGTKAKSR